MVAGAVLMLAAAAAAAQTTFAAERMVGVVPTNGSTMLIKQFSVDAGTTLTGVQIENNDATTTFPEITLLRGPANTTGSASTVASASGVHPAAGVGTVQWTTPVLVSEAGTYYVAVRFPSGPGKQGLGSGPALGASDVTTPAGSFVAASPTDEMLPIGMDLALSLVTAGGGGLGKARAALLDPEAGRSQTARLGLRIRSLGHRGGSTTLAITLPERMEASLDIFDVSGRLVREVFHGILDAGAHERRWDARTADGQPASAGTYFVRLRTPSESVTQKVTLAP
jgi:hypothetical protein